MKAALVGTSQIVFVKSGKLNLGRWQGVFFCEFDGPRDRKLHVKVLADHRSAEMFRFGAGIAVEYGAFFFISILRYEDAGVEP